MERPNLNYETLVRITKAISMLRDPEEIILVTVEGATHALNVKGCALFLFNIMNKELELAGSYGLSSTYLNKGPVSALHSMAASLKGGQPLAIFDVGDDPRIQYPQAAKEEGIASILSVPILMGHRVIGCLRLYTAEPWEFTLDDVDFTTVLAQMVGMGLEMCRTNKGLKESIDILKTMRDPRTLPSKRRTPFEGVPKSFPKAQLADAVTQ